MHTRIYLTQSRSVLHGFDWRLFEPANKKTAATRTAAMGRCRRSEAPKYAFKPQKHLGIWPESVLRSAHSIRHRAAKTTRSTAPSKEVHLRHTRSFRLTCSAKCRSRPWSAAPHDCKCQYLHRHERPALPSIHQPCVRYQDATAPMRTALMSKIDCRARQFHQTSAGDWS